MATTVQIRLDEETKWAAEDLFDSLGLDLSTAVRMFLAACMRENGLPFLPKRKFNTETIEAMEDARLGRNLSPAYKTTDEMFAAIDAENAAEGV
ncbi:MAG: type II toxin-antitoxin system RelB/DinJ family antitoxin [Spirochaetaceae bacterium]|jgi:DNA-damage-inducible protein J|nr:type II toxin-antitoxin system RelB/DinJ family antitoxin [Spirochaetaceae bacterium]